MTCSDRTRQTDSQPRTRSVQHPSARVVRLALAILCVTVLAVVQPPPTGATTYVPMTDAALTDRTPLIVEGIVVEGAPAPVNGRPATDYTISVARVLKGATSADPLTVRVPGGTGTDGAVYRVWGAPGFAAGDQVILFLSPRANGTYGVHQLMLGAFVRTSAGGTGAGALAVRDLRGTVALAPEGAVRADGSSVEERSDERVREFDAFADWIAARAAGRPAAAEYFAEAAAPPPSLAERYTLYESNGMHFRWFNGGGTWYAYQGGVDGMSGGGFAEAERALAAWNADPGSALSLTYGGTTTRDGGFSSRDSANVLLFDDPNDEIPGAFDCNSGGVLAIGGFSGTSGTADFGGTSFWKIVEGEVVTQDGAGCFFAGNGGKNGELVFGHEIGHALGFGHSCGDSGTPSCADPVLDDALMRAFAHNDGRGARLGADDRAALSVLYGDGAVAPCTVPDAPSGLTATAVSSARIDLTWTDRSSDEQGFVVESRREGASTFTIVATLPAGSRSYASTGLVADTSYSFQVRATGCDGDSAAAGPASARTLEDTPSDPPSDPPEPAGDDPADPPPDPPSDPEDDAGAPSGLRVDVLSRTSVALDWSWSGPAPRAFHVELRSGAVFVEVATVSGTRNDARLSGLQPDTGYAFRVRARTASGFGPYSSPARATTGDPAPAGRLTGAEVACDGSRLRGLLERMTVDAPNLPAGRGTGVNLSFTATGDFAGIAYTREAGASPEHQLAFSTNPEETTLLRNPERPQLFSVSLARNELNTDLVAGGAEDLLRVLVDPTLGGGGSDGAANPSALLSIDNRSGSRVGASSAKPGRGLAPLLDSCHGAFGADDVHVFRVLSKLLRVRSASATDFELAVYRGEDPGTYRVDAYGLDRHGRSLGRVAAAVSVSWTGGALDAGDLRILPACGASGGVGCTSFGDTAEIVLDEPRFRGELRGEQGDGPAVSATFAPARSNQNAPQGIDWKALLGDSTWLRPPAGVDLGEVESAGALDAAEIACDADRLEGLLSRLRTAAPGSPGRGVNLSYTATGDFAGVAYTVGAAGGERQLVFSTNPEETTLLRNPERPQLFAVSASRNDPSSDLVTSNAGLLRVLLDPTLDPGSADAGVLALDNRSGAGGTSADAKPGRGLTDLVAPCHGKLGDRDVHLFRVLSKIVRGRAAGAPVAEIAIYKGAGSDRYRIDVYPVTADGTVLGRMAVELRVEYTAGGQLARGTLRALGRCSGGQSTGCTTVDRATELFLVQPTFTGTGPERGRIVSSGGPSSASVDFADLLGATTWLRGI